MKNSYILLRKNEESGPFEFEDLQKMGLHPGDLIWVEGQSVTWQSPSEIQELKKIQLKQEGSIEKTQQDFQEKLVTGSIISTPKNGTQTKDKSVFISLPVDAIPEGNKQGTTKIYVSSAKEKDGDSVVVTIPSKNPTPDKEDNYLIKESPVTLPRITKKKEKSFSIKDAAIFIGLPIIGFLTGIGIKEYTAGKTQKTEVNPLQAGDQQNSNGTSDQASADYSDADANPNTQIPADDSMSSPGGNSIPADEKSAKPVKKSGKTENQKNNTVTEPNVASPVVKQDASTNSQEQEKPEAISPEKLATMVFISNNDFKTGAFGGIKDLQLTITNDSKYILEKVLVQLQYLKPNEEAIKTEIISFKSVPPNGTQTIPVDKSNRGVKIKYKIIKIEPGPGSPSL